MFDIIDDLQNFYETPVNVLTPFDALKRMELPKNLHVQEDYVRFHPGIIYCILHKKYLKH